MEKTLEKRIKDIEELYESSKEADDFTYFEGSAYEMLEIIKLQKQKMEQILNAVYEFGSNNVGAIVSEIVDGVPDHIDHTY